MGAGKGGPTGAGGWSANSLTAMKSATEAMARTTANEATYVHRPLAVRVPGHGSGQVRQRPGPPRACQCGRNPGPRTAPLGLTCSTVTGASSAMASFAPSAQDSARTATHGAISLSSSPATTVMSVAASRASRTASWKRARA